jgi:hypothetical protein
MFISRDPVLLNQSMLLRSKQIIEMIAAIVTLKTSKIALNVGGFAMRCAFATAVAVLAVSIAAALTVSPAAAQKKKAVAQLSVNQCIDLARKRGYTESDLTVGGGNPARTFVIRCLQGRQR